MHRRILALTATAMLLLVALHALADTVTLKNGKVIEGSVMRLGDQYRIKTADGQTITVTVSEVASVTKGSAPPPKTAPPDKPTASASATGFSADFLAAKSRADAVDAPILAVTIWEKFIDSSPPQQELDAAKAELGKWQKLQKDNAEKINGKWIGGEERKKLLKEVDRLCRQAREQLESQTLQALASYEKALRMYPNCFEANCAMGYYHLKKGAYGSTGRGNNAEIDKAIRALETAVKLRPDSPEALSNLAIGYAFKQKWEDSVLLAHRAAKIEDNREIVENLVNLLVQAPQGMKTHNRKVKPIIEEAVILAQKHGIGPQGTGKFYYLPPKPPGTDAKSPDDEKEKGPPGVIGNGSGFLVSADGYIVTNRHVVDEKNRLFRVRFDDGKEKGADVIAVDDEYDIALIKIKPDAPLPYLKLAQADLPNPGANCMVLGYPVADLLDFKMQVVSGEITSTNTDDPYHVTLAANTTHGNSGGPVVDRDGNVIGVLSAGQQAFNATYVKALSAGQIRKFLEKSRDKYTATFESLPPMDTAFDGEKLAAEARKSTLLVLIIRGDGKGTAAQSATGAERND